MPEVDLGRSASTSFAPRKVVWAILFATAAVVLPLVGEFLPGDDETHVVTGSVSVFLLSLAALQLVTGLPLNARGIALWRIGPWFLLWNGLTLGLASVTFPSQRTENALEIDLTSVISALLIVGVSIVVWTLGYLVGPPRSMCNVGNRMLSSIFRGTSSSMSGGASAWVIYGAGTAAVIVSTLITNRFGYVGDPSSLVVQASAYTNLLGVAATCTSFAIALAAYRVFTTDLISAKVTLSALVCADIVVGALQGGKQSFVLTVVAVLVSYGAARGRFPVGMVVVGTVLFLWLIVPFNTDYRQFVRTGTGTLSPSEAIAAAPKTLSTVFDSNSNVIIDSSITMLHRLREIDSIAIIEQRTPESIPYRSSLEFVEAPVLGVIPRVIWPGKPILDTGYEFGQEYYGSTAGIYSSAAITPVGDLYRHGGWPVVLVGSLVLGVGCRLFDTLLRPESDCRAIFFLLVFLPIVVKGENDMYTMIIGLPAGILTAVLGVQLACRRSRRVSRPRV